MRFSLTMPNPAVNRTPIGGAAFGAMTSDAAIDQLRLEATQLGIDIDGRWGMAAA